MDRAIEPTVHHLATSKLIMLYMDLEVLESITTLWPDITVLVDWV